MKCVEKYRVNKEGVGEMTRLLLLVPARDVGSICKPGSCGASPEWLLPRRSYFQPSTADSVFCGRTHGYLPKDTKELSLVPLRIKWEEEGKLAAGGVQIGHQELEDAGDPGQDLLCRLIDRKGPVKHSRHDLGSLC